MTNERIRALCLLKRGAYEDFPFGPTPACFRLRGRIFCELYESANNRRVTLLCDAAYAHALRHSHPDVIVAGYHCPARLKPYKNTIYLDRFNDDAALESMISHAYERAVQKLKRHEREALLAEEVPV